MPLVESSIVINASPEFVRSVFLDWAKYPEWSKAQFSKIEVQDPTQAPDPARNLPAKGAKLNVSIGTFNFSPVMISNIPDELVWLGSLPYIFTGEHHFVFKATENGSTLFENYENFTGLASIMMSVPKQAAAFQSFNVELKARCETCETFTRGFLADLISEQ